MTDLAPQQGTMENIPFELPVDMNYVGPQHEAEKTGRLANAIERAKQAGTAAVIMAEVTPTNEAMRLMAFGAGEAATHSPVVGALTLGLSTLAIEGSAALAAARGLDSETARRATTFINKKLEKIGVNRDEKISGYTKATAAFVGGSVVAMTVENLDNPDSTVEEKRRYGLLTSAWLAGVCAVAGAGGSEAVKYITENPEPSIAAAGSAVAVAAGRKLHKKRAAKRELARQAERTWDDSDKFGNVYGVITDEESLTKAAELEQHVWDEKHYGNLIEEGYSKHFETSRTLAAFNGEECVGMNRMFVAHEDIVPPFLETEMPYDDESERAKIIELARQGLVEELGTVAVAPDMRGKDVNLRLWRLAYRDARARGVKYWGIIMEPERVEKMNKHQAFTFRRLGEAVEYQGGACAAHIMDLEEVDESMRRNKRLNHFWFVRKKLNRVTPTE